MRIRRLRKLQARTCAGFAVLAMALSVLSGCATDGKVKTATVANKPSAGTGSPVAKPVANGPSVVAGPSVARLVDGREGFVITEVPTMDAASRRDFDRAVALMKGKDYVQAIDLLEKVI